MSEAFVGQSTIRELEITDLGGVPVVDATVTYSLRSPSGTALVAAATAPHTGDGWYSYTILGSLLPTAGWYEETWDGTSGSTLLPHYSGFQVDYAEGPAVTRWEVRHQAADLNGDLWTGIVDSATSLTFTDADRTLEPDNHWRGTWVYVYGGTGRGQERRISANTQSSGICTVTRPWSPTPDAGSYYELHKQFSVSQYNRAINAAIDALNGHVWVPMTDESITVSDADVYEYALPAEMEWVRAVYALDTSTTPAPDWGRLRAPATDYELVRGRRTLRVKAPIESTRLRVVGDRPPWRVERDAAFVPVNATYLACAANALLWQSAMLSPQLDTKAAAVRAKAFTDQANALLPMRRPGKGARRV